MQFKISEPIPSEELSEVPEAEGLMMAVSLPPAWQAVLDRVIENIKASFIDALPEWPVVEEAIRAAVNAWLGGKVPPFVLRIVLNYMLPVLEQAYNDLKHKTGLVTE